MSLDGSRDGGGSGWASHPEGIESAVVGATTGDTSLAGVGAICDLEEDTDADGEVQGFRVSEYMELRDGRRIILHSDRGFTIGLRSTSDSGVALRDVESEDGLRQHVLNVLLPDDDQPEQDHPWDWLAELSRARGLHVSATDLQSVPYRVVLSEGVKRWLGRPPESQGRTN